MKAFYFSHPGSCQLIERPDPTLNSKFNILLKVKACGVCKTDYHIASLPQLHPGENGIILGHEIVGEIVDIYSPISGSKLKIGDLCTVTPNVPCMECKNCKCGLANICVAEQKTVIGITVDGGLAEYVSVPHVSVHKVPENVNLENAIFAEPMTCVLDAFVSAGDLYGKNVVIAGAGPAGLLFCILAKHFGANTVISTDISQYRIDKALEFGADHVMISQDGVFPDGITTLCDDVDIVFDTVGTLVDGALKIVRRGGKVIIYGLDQNARIPISPFDIVLNKKQVLGGFANSQLMWRVSNILANVDLNKLITHRIGLDDMSLQSLARINSDEVLKMVVYPNQ